MRCRWRGRLSDAIACSGTLPMAEHGRTPAASLRAQNFFPQEKNGRSAWAARWFNNAGHPSGRHAGSSCDRGVASVGQQRPGPTLSSSPAQAVESTACAAGVAAGPRRACARARSAAGTPVLCKISPHAGTARCSAGCGAPAACAAGLGRPALPPHAECVARRGARALRHARRAGFASRRRHAALELVPCGTAAARRSARASEVRDAVLQAELVQAHGDLLGGRPLRRLQLPCSGR